MSNKLRSVKREQTRENTQVKGRAKTVLKDIAKNVVVVGKCGCCEGEIITYLGSKPENIFNTYCMGDCRRISDIRFPKKDDVFYLSDIKQPPVSLLIGLYAAIKKDITDEQIKNTSVSEIVTKD